MRSEAEYMLDLIACSTMSGDGYIAPQANINIDEIERDEVVVINAIDRFRARRYHETNVSRYAVSIVLGIVRRGRVMRIDVETECAALAIPIRRPQVLKALQELVRDGTIEKSSSRSKQLSGRAIYWVAKGK